MLRNTLIYYALKFLLPVNFTFTIWTFFFTTYLGFSYSQALLLISLQFISITIFELPSGAWADRYGRKNMYIAGIILTLIQLLVWCFSSSFMLFGLAAAISGIASAFLSGNLEALIHDSIQTTKNGHKQYIKTIAYGNAIGFTGKALTALVAGYMFIYNPLFPVYATIVITIIMLFLTLLLQEPDQSLSASHDNFIHIKKTLSFLISDNKLSLIFLIIFIESVTGGVYYFLQQEYLARIGYSIEFISITFALGAGISAIGSVVLRKINDRVSQTHMLQFIIFTILLANILFAVYNKYFAIVGLIIISLTYGYYTVFFTDIIVNKVAKTHKSTFLSLFSLTMMIGFALTNLLASFIVKLIDLQFIFVGNAIILGLLLLYILTCFRIS